MIAIAAAALLAAADPGGPDETARTLAAVQAMYAQSCQVRAYGSYDDLCDALKKQLKAAERAQKQKVRDVKPPPPEPRASAPLPVAASAPAKAP